MFSHHHGDCGLKHDCSWVTFCFGNAGTPMVLAQLLPWLTKMVKKDVVGKEKEKGGRLRRMEWKRDWEVKKEGEFMGKTGSD